MLKLIKQFLNKKILHKDPSPKGPIGYISAESFYNTYKWYRYSKTRVLKEIKNTNLLVPADKKLLTRLIKKYNGVPRSFDELKKGGK